MITKQNAAVWYAPTKDRRYLSKAGAIHAEAKAKIFSRYPSEKQEDDEQGRTTYPGWSMPYDEPDRYAKMLRRLKRIIAKSTQ